MNQVTVRLIHERIGVKVCLKPSQLKLGCPLSTTPTNLAKSFRQLIYPSTFLWERGGGWSSSPTWRMGPTAPREEKKERKKETEGGESGLI